MTAEQKMCDDPGLGILLTDGGTAWSTLVRHNRTGESIVVTLTPAGGTDVGYWHIRVANLREGVEENTIRPVSPYGVGLFLPEMGVDLPANWRRVKPDA